MGFLGNATLCYVVLVLPSVVSQVYRGTINKNSITYGKKLEGSLSSKIALEIYSPSWIICARYCLVRPVCKSFVYDTSTRDCTGYIVTTGGNYWLLTHATSSYAEVSDLPQALAGPCADHSCRLNEMCTPQAETNRSCVIIGQCNNPPPSGEVRMILSNSFEKNVKVRFDCSDSEDQRQPSTVSASTSWCFGREKWTPTTFTCHGG